MNCSALSINLGMMLHHLHPDRGVIFCNLVAFSPYWKSKAGCRRFNARQCTTAGVAEKLARPIATPTILPLSALLQHRRVCYVKPVKRRVLLQTKSSTGPTGKPVGGAPIAHIFTPLNKSLGSRFVLSLNQIALHSHLATQQPVRVAAIH